MDWISRYIHHPCRAVCPHLGRCQCQQHGLLSDYARGLHRHFAAAVAAELVDGAVDGTRAGAHDDNPKTTTPPRALHTELLRVVALLEHRDAPAKS